MNQLPILYKDHPELRLPAHYLSDETYTQAIDGFVVVCADIVFIDRAKEVFYLAKRQTKPHSDWYIIGGRMRRGETEKEAACKNIKRETSLDIDQDRVTFVTLTRYWWSERQQPPQENGADTLIFNFAVELSPDEIQAASANLDPVEYDADLGLRAFTYNDLVAANAHPFLLDLYRQIFSKQRDYFS